MKKHQIIYILISPDGNCYTINPIVMYATTAIILTQRLNKELHRKIRNIYQQE
ncbi:hypothetical protein PDN54_26100 [Bacillus cereus group sp. Bc252]|uniref:hypothetical protein n=1 Tax=Bacillus TaxID=1386 RepID=UPI00146C94AF|nr:MULTISPECIES: hypothetical protein [Bacillus cereus group]MCU5204555.1 hypothetical protein [Bacillus paranthracis]MDA2163680.1 hypothetical protein [Bacillus cereus group sp. Bc252]MDF9511784.1 hypothetical protein [Bacillus paranthracis]MDF9671369.1 hypothetical protein [Bacillus paranthracis]MDG1611034.1 hypothetical protein [Bacillus paranthracis]